MTGNGELRHGQQADSVENVLDLFAREPRTSRSAREIRFANPRLEHQHPVSRCHAIPAGGEGRRTVAISRSASTSGVVLCALRVLWDCFVLRRIRRRIRRPRIQLPRTRRPRTIDLIQADQADAIDDLWQLGKPVGQGGPWFETAVKVG